MKKLLLRIEREGIAVLEKHEKIIQKKNPLGAIFKKLVQYSPPCCGTCYYGKMFDGHGPVITELGCWDDKEEDCVVFENAYFTWKHELL